MPRIARIDFPGALHHITIRGNNKQRIFLSEDDHRFFLSLLGQVISEFGLSCYAYCLMSNHFHLLLESVQGNVSLAMRKLNGFYAKYFNKKEHRVGHLFQERFHSELIKTDSHLLETLRYIHLNPIAGGLVSRPEEWPWSSYQAITGSSPKPAWLDVDKALGFFQPSPDPQGAFARFVCAGLSTNGDSH